MLITLLFPNHDPFTVEISSAETIRCLKQKIEEVKGANFPAKYTQLAFGGQYLLDKYSIQHYNLRANKIVVGLINPLNSTVSKDLNGMDMSVLNDAINSTERERIHSNEWVVQTMIDMGYTRLQARNALRVSFYNIDRAIDYLIATVDDADLGSAGENSPNSEIDEPRPGPSSRDW